VSDRENLLALLADQQRDAAKHDVGNLFVDVADQIRDEPRFGATYAGTTSAGRANAARPCERVR
jgi:hypothetical protein